MKYLLRAVLFLAILAVGFASYSFYVWRAPFVRQQTLVMVERGTGTRGIVKDLHAQGVTPPLWKIVLPLGMSSDLRSLKAGEYQFDEGLSPQQVFTSIARGDVVVHAVTVPEGFTVAQVRKLLLAEKDLTGELPAQIAEGSLFPDTVHFVRGDTRASIIERMQKQQRELLNDAWMRRADDLPLRSPEEALTLASIVEEETGVDEERGPVAAVYINRLRQGMRLQADPTVAYGIAPGGMTRALTSNDLKRDNPYNTYTRDGLPPGPICNPGKAAIEAVMNPPQSEHLFFVATGNGGHNFARTMKEHEANVAKYRAARRASRH